MRLNTKAAYRFAALLCAALAVLTAGSAHTQMPLAQSVSNPHGRFAMRSPTRLGSTNDGKIVLRGISPEKGGY